ncbi:MAG: hypothetical protein ABI806_14885 [Candidatus Solibacter sp.]
MNSLLDAGDGDAIDAIQPVTDALAGVVEAEVLASLRDSVDELDFNAALFKQGEIATEVNLSLDEPQSRTLSQRG